MNTPPNNTPGSAGVSDPGYSRSSTQPFYWSVWLELWENRSIYVAPLIVGVVVLFGFLVSTVGMPERRQAVLLLDPAHQRAAIGAPYDIRRRILLPRCAAQRTSRSQHSVLEITAGFGSHNRSLEG